MGIISSCCNWAKLGLPEERIPLRGNKLSRYNDIDRSKKLLNSSVLDDGEEGGFDINPEIQEFLEAISSDDGTGDFDDDFEKLMATED